MFAATVALATLVAAASCALAAIRSSEAAAAVVARVDDRPVRRQVAELERHRAQLQGLLDDRSHR